MKKDETTHALETASARIVTATRNWVEKAVIGLNLCPFAKAVHTKGQIRYVVSTADTQQALLLELASEMTHLLATDPVEIDTTLLIHPHVLGNFLEYNDFLAIADAAIDRLGFEGQIQIASFHPHYQFAGSSPEDIENYTNRSPYPMLHLLREASVERAVASFPDAAEIFDRNIETMRRLGPDGWRRLELAASLLEKEKIKN